MATVIRVDGSLTEVHPVGKKFTLVEMYTILSCTTVERLRVPGRPVRWMWMDEDGRGRGLAPCNAATSAANFACSWHMAGSSGLAR